MFKPQNAQQFPNMNQPYNTRIQPPNASSPTYSSPLDQIKQYTSKFEDLLENNMSWVKPYIPAIGRFLIVVTFLEDALRIMTQFGDQIYYLTTYRRFLPWGIAHIFLVANVCAMLTGSYMVVSRKNSELGVGALLGVVVSQALGYGLVFDVNFFFRNLSVIGGLLMVLSDSFARRRITFPGLPELSDPSATNKTYFQLAGRVLLIFLFLGLILRGGTWTMGRIVITIFGLLACTMVAVGFKAKYSAVVLVAMLSVFNVLINNFWSVGTSHPHRDFLKYDFFQTLSIIGGFLLLVNMGPGGLSVDEKKKVY